MRRSFAQTPFRWWLSVLPILAVLGCGDGASDACRADLERFEESLAARLGAWRTATAELALPPAEAFEVFDPSSGFEAPGAELLLREDRIVLDRSRCFAAQYSSPGDRTEICRVGWDVAFPRTVPPSAPLDEAAEVRSRLVSVSTTAHSICHARLRLMVDQSASAQRLVTLLAGIARVPGSPRLELRLTNGAVSLPDPAAYPEGERLTVVRGPAGLTLRSSGGVLAPGCEAVADPATGPTIPAVGPAADASLRRCLSAVAEVYPHWGATVEVPAETPAWEAARLWLAVDAGPMEGPTALRVSTSRPGLR